MLKLKDLFSATNSVDLKDVKPVKAALNQFGYYDPPDFGMTEIPDTKTFTGIKAYQKSRGLRIDGVMTPGGETERQMNKDLSGTNPPPSPSAEKAPPNRPTALPDKPEPIPYGRGASRMGVPKLPTPENPAVQDANAALRLIPLIGQALKQLGKSPKLKPGQGRTLPAEQPPRLPPLPAEPPKLPSQTESPQPDKTRVAPATPPFPARPEDGGPTVTTSPDLSDEIEQGTTVESRKKRHDLDLGAEDRELPEGVNNTLEYLPDSQKGFVKESLLNSGKLEWEDKNSIQIGHDDKTIADAAREFTNIQDRLGVPAGRSKRTILDNGETIDHFKADNGTIVRLRRFSKEGSPTLEIELPKTKPGAILKIKKRYRKR